MEPSRDCALWPSPRMRRSNAIRRSAASRPSLHPHASPPRPTYRQRKGNSAIPSTPITASGAGDNSVVAGIPGYSIRVIGFALSFSAAVNAKFVDGPGGTLLAGLFYAVGANPPPVIADAPADLARGLFQTSKGNALTLNLSGAVPVGGVVIWEKAPQA